MRVRRTYTGYITLRDAFERLCERRHPELFVSPPPENGPPGLDISVLAAPVRQQKNDARAKFDAVAHELDAAIGQPLQPLQDFSGNLEPVKHEVVGGSYRACFFPEPLGFVDDDPVDLWINEKEFSRWLKDVTGQPGVTRLPEAKAIRVCKKLIADAQKNGEWIGVDAFATACSKVGVMSRDAARDFYEKFTPEEWRIGRGRRGGLAVSADQIADRLKLLIAEI